MCQQLDIFTGDGGFDLSVDGKTTLIGKAITTDAALVSQVATLVLTNQKAEVNLTRQLSKAASSTMATTTH